MEEFQIRFGQHLKKLRGKVTQEQLAERTGLAKNHLSTIERGISRPSLDTLKKIADALGLTVCDLFRFEHEARDLQELKDKIIIAVKEVDNDSSPEVLYTKILNIFIHNNNCDK